MAYTPRFTEHKRIKGDKKASTFGKSQAIKPKRITNDTELAYNHWLHEDEQMNNYACFLCGVPVEEWHHVKLDSNSKKRHFVQIPVCKHHHTGLGLSPHGTPKRFRNAYSMEEQELFALKIYLKYMGTL